MINLILIILGLSLCLNVFFINTEWKRYLASKQIKLYVDSLLLRNTKIAEFRTKALKELGQDLYNLMPDYKTMMESEDEITLEKWIPADKLEEAKLKWK